MDEYNKKKNGTKLINVNKTKKRGCFNGTNEQKNYQQAEKKGKNKKMYGLASLNNIIY